MSNVDLDSITDDQIGGCGVSLGMGLQGLEFCPCEDYTLDEWSTDPFGEHRDLFCTCGHHRVMHATNTE